MTTTSHRRAAVTWRGWLHDQRGRRDPVGELARAVLGGLCPGGCRFTSWPSMVSHLSHHPEAPDVVFAAARRALKEHRARGGRP